MSSDVFDAVSYLARYPEVLALGMDAREHHEKFGKRLGYGDDNQQSSVNQFQHLVGQRSGRVDANYDEASASFGVSQIETRPQSLEEAMSIWCTAAAADLSFQKALREQFLIPEQKMLYSDVFFDPFAVYSRGAGMQMSNTALIEAIRHQHNRDNGLFDTADYLSRYPDVKESGMIPALHFVEFGSSEQRTAQFALSNPRVVKPDWRSISTFLSPSNESMQLANTQLRHWLMDVHARVITAGLANRGWTGEREIDRSSRFYALTELPEGDLVSVYDQASTYMVNRFYENAPTVENTSVDHNWSMALGWGSAQRQPPERDLKSLFEDGVSIVIPFWGHFEEFGQCISSIALMVEATQVRFAEYLKIEVLIVNDDAIITEDDIDSIVPFYLKPFVRILSTTGNEGTTLATNLGIAEARYGWIMFVDCDDIVLPDALLVVNHYSSKLGARYISSSLIDIDSSNSFIRFRRHIGHVGMATQLGMIAGHLKVIHKSVFDEFGPLDPSYDSCQDYELLLRIGSKVRVALIPEYLYLYRWHRKTQSVSNFQAQELAAAAARARHLLPLQLLKRRPATSHRIGLVIRTQGERNNGLAEAILSCQLLDPAVKIVPIVVVHGDEGLAEWVKASMASRGINPDSWHCVSAPDTTRKRGYPINVGFEFAFKNLDCTGVGILDDDDILLPGYSTMVRSLENTAPHLVSGRTLASQNTNHRVEMHLPAPAAVLALCNFITTNGFVANRAAIEAAGAGTLSPVSEDLHYLEDWEFMLKCVDAGVMFSVVDAFVGEFRLGSDGNSEKRKFPFEFERCRARVEQLAQRLSRRSGEELVDLQRAFPTRMIRNLNDQQKLFLRTIQRAGERDK
jgi:glycosyltransferase involved in cell wall biosynthesis